MTSPSSSVTRRSTPWVEGCWGPRLMTIGSRVPGSRSWRASMEASASCVVMASAPAIARSVSVSSRPSRRAASIASRASSATGMAVWASWSWCSSGYTASVNCTSSPPSG